jgi:GNAT superfamily N-acetyltransferase
VIDVRALTEEHFARVGAALPLHRFDGFNDDSTYLVAWDADVPVGHVHVAWRRTALQLPELQDMYVLPDRRSRGIGARLVAAAERLAAANGHAACSLSVSKQNLRARALYERLGYSRAPIEPKRVHGTITTRAGSFEVDDTLLYFTKRVVDLAASRSS